MKKIILIPLILMSLVSCNHIAKEERVLIKGENDVVLVLNTPKARCHKCQKIIEDGLQKIDGVHQSILDLNIKQISIVYDPKNTTPEKLSSAVKELTTQIPCK
ncbi:heavy-metal-associated domain-containing protein [Aquimarina pacifica]|uniref:heavy-metal-associated domain-containing protein n=1 Tax=Aquimarina pacifica TaxID=1296415 RepID=UPI0004715B6F|nr:heavy metal-associated domain-containing protein [Aquimarina pacifica]